MIHQTIFAKSQHSSASAERDRRPENVSFKFEFISMLNSVDFVDLFVTRTCVPQDLCVASTNGDIHSAFLPLLR